MLSPKIKTSGKVSIGLVLTVIAHVIIAMFGDGDLEFADTLTYVLQGVRLPAVLDAAGKNIVPVEFGRDMLLPSTPLLELMGGLDLSVKAGDVLVFRKEGSRWVEVGRYLIDSEVLR